MQSLQPLMPIGRLLVLVALVLVFVAIPHPSSAQANAAGGKAQSHKKPGFKPLDGTTYDYEYPIKAAPQPAQSWLGRAFVHQLAAKDPKTPLPLFVFIHGINAELIKYRWMGGGHEGDVRRIASDMMEEGKIPPILVAAPSAVLPAATAVARTSWPAFDLDNFLDITQKQLQGIATIDTNRVIVAGHSGGACNKKGGIASAIQASKVHAALVIDGCMDVDFAVAMAQAKPTTHVVVSWQTLSWQKRPFGDFERAFRREVEQHPAAPNILRELEHLRPTEPMPHDAMVPLVMKRWLPKLLGKI